MKRLVLFLLTNIAVLALITIVVRVTGADQALAVRGMDWHGLLVFAAVIGFAGSLISLALSKWQAKTFMGVQVIGQPQTETESWLFETVRDHASRLGLGMPEVGVYDGPEMNAFATGASRNHALVAVSTGLLRGMRREEAQAVLGHEMTHAANGDMVTLALIQGVVNTFVIFLSRVLGTLLDSFLSGGRGGGRRVGREPRTCYEREQSENWNQLLEHDDLHKHKARLIRISALFDPVAAARVRTAVHYKTFITNCSASRADGVSAHPQRISSGAGVAVVNGSAARPRASAARTAGRSETARSQASARGAADSLRRVAESAGR